MLTPFWTLGLQIYVWENSFSRAIQPSSETSVRPWGIMDEKDLSRRQTGIIKLANQWTYCTAKLEFYSCPQDLVCTNNQCFLLDSHSLCSWIVVFLSLFFLYCSVLWELGHITCLLSLWVLSHEKQPCLSLLGMMASPDVIIGWGFEVCSLREGMNACHPKCIKGKNGVMDVGQPKRWTILIFLY